MSSQRELSFSTVILDEGAVISHNIPGMLSPGWGWGVITYIAVFYIHAYKSTNQLVHIFLTKSLDVGPILLETGTITFPSISSSISTVLCNRVQLETGTITFTSISSRISIM